MERGPWSIVPVRALPLQVRLVFQDANHCTALHAPNENRRLPSVCDFFLGSPKLSASAFRAGYIRHNKLA